jgi:hypothetical protein
MKKTRNSKKNTRGNSLSNADIDAVTLTDVDANATAIDANATTIDANATAIDANITATDSNTTVVDANATATDNTTTISSEVLAVILSPPLPVTKGAVKKEKKQGPPPMRRLARAKGVSHAFFKNHLYEQ